MSFNPRFIYKELKTMVKRRSRLDRLSSPFYQQARENKTC